MEKETRPQVVDLTRDFIRKCDMEDRIEVEGGEIRDDPGRGYDVVVVSPLLHKFRTHLPSIFAKAASSLRLRGLFVSNHRICLPVDRSDTSRVRELDLSIHCFGHPLCQPEEYVCELFRNGPAVTEQIPISGTSGFSRVHSAEKVLAGCRPVPNQKEASGCPSCQ